MCRRKGWMRRSGQRGRRVYGGWGERRKKKKKEEKEYVADVTRAYGSARLGSARLARLEIFKALFGYPLSGEGEGRRGDERVCVTLLADTGGFERKAHKYA